MEDVKLGEGSFGQVWRGVNRSTGEFVAVKQANRSKQVLGRSRCDLSHEAAIMLRVCHENVLKVYGLFKDAGRISVVFEYCDGGDFSEKLKLRPEQPTGPCEFIVASWMQQICSAIAALHAAGIVHRDIKPSNFMLSRGVLKLVDFGIAQILPSSGFLYAKCGSPGFMSPEQLLLPMSGGYSSPVDMWAAGIVLYMMLHGGNHPHIEKGKHNMQAMFQRSASKTNDFVWNARTVHSLCETKETQNAKRGSIPGVGWWSLLDGMLEPDPKKRLTALEALRHPWIIGKSSSYE
jgi:serine/threonine-protein kinase ULK/ATG1